MKIETVKNVFFIVILTTLSIANINAVDFRKGYVITLNNDTLYGEIANTNYYEHSLKCIFKENSKVNETSYNPNQLNGYRFIDGKYYISKKILVDNIPTTFFMEYLINGKLKIYFRQEKGLINHYYAENDTSGIRELIYINEIVYNGDGFFNIEKKKYVGLLDVLTADCPTIQNDIAKINDPDHKKLINLAKKYHNLSCPNNNCLIYEKEISTKIKIEALTATNFFLFSYPIQTYGLNVLFSNTKISENVYIGLGVLYSPFLINNPEFFATAIRIPLSFNYINNNNGFSPLFSMAFDINRLAATQSYGVGVKYQINKISFNLTTELQTAIFIMPYSAGLRFGLMYDL